MTSTHIHELNKQSDATHTQRSCAMKHEHRSVLSLVERRSTALLKHREGSSNSVVLGVFWRIFEPTGHQGPSFTSEHCSLNRKQRRRKRMLGCTMRQLAQLSVNAKNEIMTGSCQSWVHCYDWLICILDMLRLPASGWCCPVFLCPLFKFQVGIMMDCL